MRIRMAGFTLIELIIVTLIIGILAAVAAPLYLGYLKDAKLIEAKGIAGAVWTSVQANSVAACGQATPVTTAFSRAGLNAGGLTADGRWQVSGAGTLMVNCATGAITAVPGNPVFAVAGRHEDVNALQVGLFYDPLAQPPSMLRCSIDGTAVSEASTPCG